jgi:chromosomal replication initiation ATPase DnaA
MRRPGEAVAKLEERLARLEKLVLPIGETLLPLVEAFVCEEFRISKATLHSKRRYQYIADARFAVWLIANLKGVRPVILAELLSKPTGTIYHGIETANAMMETDPIFRGRVSAVLARLNGDE